MFIGEAPGEQEDLTGEPFVGRAGNCSTGFSMPSTLGAKMFT